MKLQDIVTIYNRFDESKCVGVYVDSRSKEYLPQDIVVLSLIYGCCKVDMLQYLLVDYAVISMLSGDYSYFRVGSCGLRQEG